MKYLFIFALFSTMLNASATMCYKNNHNDPSSIENETLDGGECKGEYTLTQMKEKGWIVDDMKVSIKDESTNYIYILKKDKSEKKVAVSGEIDYKKLAEGLQKQKEKQEEIDMIERGRVFYSKTCIACHGEKGEIEVRNTSRAINTLSLEEMKESLWGYQWKEYDRGWARIMEPYANLIVEKDTEAVYKYLQTLK